MNMIQMIIGIRLPTQPNLKHCRVLHRIMNKMIIESRRNRSYISSSSRIRRK